jgi:hypothetical protein
MGHFPFAPMKKESELKQKAAALRKSTHADTNWNEFLRYCHTNNISARRAKETLTEAGFHPSIARGIAGLIRGH